MPNVSARAGKVSLTMESTGYTGYKVHSAGYKVHSLEGDVEFPNQARLAELCREHLRSSVDEFARLERMLHILIQPGVKKDRRARFLEALAQETKVR
jgi:hypothetical protein